MPPPTITCTRIRLPRPSNEKFNWSIYREEKKRQRRDRCKKSKMDLIFNMHGHGFYAVYVMGFLKLLGMCKRYCLLCLNKLVCLFNLNQERIHHLVQENRLL